MDRSSAVQVDGTVTADLLYRLSQCCAVLFFFLPLATCCIHLNTIAKLVTVLSHKLAGQCYHSLLIQANLKRVQMSKKGKSKTLNTVMSIQRPCGTKFHPHS